MTDMGEMEFPFAKYTPVKPWVGSLRALNISNNDTGSSQPSSQTRHRTQKMEPSINSSIEGTKNVQMHVTGSVQAVLNVDRRAAGQFHKVGGSRLD